MQHFSRASWVAAAALAAGWAGVSTTFAATVTTASGNGADAMVANYGWDNNYNNWSANVNFNGVGLNVYPAGTTEEYVRFDLSSQGLSGSQVSGASLQLTLSSYNFPSYWSNGAGTFVTDPPVTFSVYGLTDAAGSQNWSESTITWNTAPDAPSASGPTANVQLLGQITVPYGAGGTTVTMLDSSTSPALLAFLQGNTNGQVTFVIAGGPATWNDAVTFADKENTGGYAPPTLLVTVPEPASMGLAFGAVSVLGLGRRRLSM